MHVIIAGGGIGGLSAAHYLSKFPQYKITVIERNSECGGQARSKWVSIGDSTIHTEYCWHAIGSGYNNMWPLLDELGVATNCKPMQNFIYASGGELMQTDTELITGVELSQLPQSLRKLHLSYGLFDLPLLAKTAILSRGPEFLFKLFGTTKQAVIAKYDDVSTADIARGRSAGVKRVFVDAPGIYLGEDVTRFSYATMLRLLSDYAVAKSKFNDLTTAPFWAFAGPTNDIFIDPWVEQLKSRGVNFVRGNIKRIVRDELKITTIITEDSTFGCDIFVNAMSVESAAKLLGDPQLKQLAENSRQLQTQVTFTTPFRVTGSLDKSENNPKFPVITLFDSPWFIMIKVESQLFDIPGDILSCGIGLVERNGLNGKKFINCTRDEAISECWAQIVKYAGDVPVSHQGQIGRLSDFSADELIADIWSSYVFGTPLDTYEPKFSNSVNTQRFRPQTTSSIPNLFHSTAYTILNQGDSDIFNMETAVTAGMRAAEKINEYTALLCSDINTQQVL